MFRKKAQVTRQNRKSILSPSSSFAYVESYKSLRANIEFSTFDGELKTIVFTSSIPNEGKSSVVVNTATTLAEKGYKVLLVDADLRFPSITQYLGVRTRNQKGLSTVLSGKNTIQDVLYSYKPSSFDVILAGPIPPNPTELISRDRTNTLFEELKTKYDYILIDTPPAGVVSDAMLLSKYADGTIFVVRHNFAEKDMVKESLKKLASSKVRILGSIFNNYDVSKDIKATDQFEYAYNAENFNHD